MEVEYGTECSTVICHTMFQTLYYIIDSNKYLTNLLEKANVDHSTSNEKNIEISVLIMRIIYKILLVEEHPIGNMSEV